MLAEKIAKEFLQKAAELQHLQVFEHGSGLRDFAALEEQRLHGGSVQRRLAEHLEAEVTAALKSLVDEANRYKLLVERLQAEDEELKAKNEELEARIEAMKDNIYSLRSSSAICEPGTTYLAGTPVETINADESSQ